MSHEFKIASLNALAEQLYSCHKMILGLREFGDWTELEQKEIEGIDTILRTLWAEIIGIRESSIVKNGK